MIYSKDTIGERSFLSEPTNIEDKGLGNVLILLVILQCLDSGELLITDTVKVNDLVAKESIGPNAIKFKREMKLT